LLAGCKRVEASDRREAVIHQALLHHVAEHITGRRDAALGEIGWTDARRAPLTLGETLGKQRCHRFPIGCERRHIGVALWWKLASCRLPVL